ncbi:MAG: M12 family metallo-peptidase [Saprospiraceae bacterium]|nr:M12 family metallo-peptidase [Saprospiraceae bacterium]
MRYTLFLLFLLSSFVTFAQSPMAELTGEVVLEEQVDDAFVFELSTKKVKDVLKSAPRFDQGNEWILMELPLADGSYHEVEVAEAPVVAQAIYDRYPENRSYKVRGVKDKFISGRMSISSKGISALLYTKKGNVFIENVEGSLHKAYNYQKGELNNFSCGTDHSNFKSPKKSDERTSIGSNERKYTIAIASSGEFSAKHGNNLATINGIISDYLTLLNTLYERDAAITFELTADNDDIIFFDPNTDGLNPSNNTTKLNTAQSVINAEIGSANYDIGHVFYEMNPPSSGWWSSGVASLGVVCSSSSKARGWTGAGGPYPNSFWMETFAHEIGHQFSATHTFYGTTGNCAGSQRSIGNGVEPGSGNSLMSYEGSCGSSGSCASQNIQPEADFYYFHSYSIEQIQNFVSGSGNCYSSTSTGNSPPAITMPASKTIPKETPFYLSATVTDADGDPLLLSWEEVDTDNLSLSCPNGEPNDAANSTTAPLFRSFDPSAGGGMRYFPQLSDILDDTQTMGEILPEVGRTIDMRFSARGIDANGISGVSYEDVTITVDGNSGPFEVSTANSPTAYLAGETVSVSWLVGNTDMSPISCTHVNILFSNDGGNTFPITLASNTENDGSHSVTMPGNSTEEGRIKIEAVNNIFFSINKGDITIISSCVTNSSTIVNDDDVTADAGDPSLNLELSIAGAEITSVAGDIEGSDPTANLIAEESSSGNCVAIGQNPFYDTYKYIASAADTYTFNVSGNFIEIVNVYEDEYVPTSNCLNWLASNATFNSPNISVGSTVSVTLNEGDIIEKTVSGLFTNETGAYTVTISSSGSGTLLSADVIPTGFVYKYVIYNAAGNIIAIEDEADLSDENTYYNDVYTVKGLLVLSAVNLSSYINSTFSLLQSDVVAGTVCGEFSNNDVTVTVNGCTAGVKMVTSALDNGSPGTLRYLVENACPGDIIQFDASLLNATIILNSEIDVTDNMSIAGFGINSFTLSGGNSNRIFNISAGVTVLISDMALINGFASSNGGALLNNGMLEMDNVKFEGNKNGLVSKAFTNLGELRMSNTIEILD